MVFFRCRTFLGCLPLRSGVWVLALVGFMLGTASSVGGWLQVKMIDTHPVEFIDMIALFAQAGVFSLMGLLSILGFASAVSKSRGFAYIYSKLIIIHLALLVAVCGYVMFSTFRPIPEASVRKCLKNSQFEDLVVQFCEHKLSLVKGVAIAAFGMSFIVQIYSLILTTNYAEKLDIDRAARLSHVSFGTGLKGDLYYGNSGKMDV